MNPDYCDIYIPVFILDVQTGKEQGPVVQSIISLMKMLVLDLLSLPMYFLLRIVRRFGSAKGPHLFHAKMTVFTYKTLEN